MTLGQRPKASSIVHAAIDSCTVVDVGGSTTRQTYRFDHHQGPTGKLSLRSVGMVLALEQTGREAIYRNELRSLDDLDWHCVAPIPPRSLLIWSMCSGMTPTPATSTRSLPATLMADLIIERFERAANAKLKASNTLDVISQGVRSSSRSPTLPDMAFEVAKRSETQVRYLASSRLSGWRCTPTGDRTSQSVPEAVAGLRGGIWRYCPTSAPTSTRHPHLCTRVPLSGAGLVRVHTHSHSSHLTRRRLNSRLRSQTSLLSTSLVV